MIFSCSTEDTTFIIDGTEPKVTVYKAPSFTEKVEKHIFYTLDFEAFKASFIQYLSFDKDALQHEANCLMAAYVNCEDHEVTEKGRDLKILCAVFKSRFGVEPSF